MFRMWNTRGWRAASPSYNFPMRKLFRLGVVLLSLAACAKKSTDCNQGSNICTCDRTTLSGQNPDCRDYDTVSKSSAESYCTTAGGTFRTSSVCTTSNRVGTCKFTSGSEITYQRYYSADFASAAAGATVCAYYKANCFVLSGNMLCDAVWTSDI